MSLETSVPFVAPTRGQLAVAMLWLQTSYGENRDPQKEPILSILLNAMYELQQRRQTTHGWDPVALYVAATAVNDEVKETLESVIALDSISDEEVVEVSAGLLRDLRDAAVPR